MTDLHSSVKGIIYSFNFPRFFLVLFWLFGLFTGCQIALTLSQETLAMMCSVRAARFSIAGLLLSLLIPYGISMLVTHIHKLHLLFPIAFMKAFLFSLCAAAFVRSFGDSGWLLTRLFMFSESLGSAVLLWYWVQQTGKCADSILKTANISFFAILIVVLFDVFMVVPFTSLLF